MNLHTSTCPHPCFDSHFARHVTFLRLFTFSFVRCSLPPLPHSTLLIMSSHDVAPCSRFPFVSLQPWTARLPLMIPDIVIADDVGMRSPLDLVIVLALSLMFRTMVETKLRNLHSPLPMRPLRRLALRLPQGCPIDGTHDIDCASCIPQRDTFTIPWLFDLVALLHRLPPHACPLPALFPLTPARIAPPPPPLAPPAPRRPSARAQSTNAR